MSTFFCVCASRILKISSCLRRPLVPWISSSWDNARSSDLVFTLSSWRSMSWRVCVSIAIPPLGLAIARGGRGTWVLWVFGLRRGRWTGRSQGQLDDPSVGTECVRFTVPEDCYNEDEPRRTELET